MANSSYMESFLPSEIGRLIYGYLLQCDSGLADAFLNSSKVMEECRLSKIRSRRFSAKVQGLSLVDILDQYSILCSLIFKNLNESEGTHRNLLQLLKKVLCSKGVNESLLEDILTKFDDSVQSVERQEASINQSVSECVSQAAIYSSIAEASVENTDVPGNIVTEVASNMVVETTAHVTEAPSNTAPEPVESISLLESDNEVINKVSELFRDASPIDLTSPCRLAFESIQNVQPQPDSSESTKIELNIPPAVETNVEKIKVPVSKKPKSDISKAPVSELKPQKIQKSEISKNTRVGDNKNGHTALNGYICKNDEYLLLDPKRKYIFGESVFYSNSRNALKVVESTVNSSQAPVQDPVDIPMELSEKNNARIDRKNANNLMKQRTELAPKLNQNVSKPVERRVSPKNSRVASSQEPPKSHAKIAPVNREPCKKSDSKSSTVVSTSKDIQTPKPTAEICPMARDDQTKKPPLLLNHLMKPEANDGKKIPWDFNLRRMLTEAEESASKVPLKTPKKCKKEASKSDEQSAKKRNNEDPEDAPRPKRSCRKRTEVDKSLENQNENINQNLLNVEHPSHKSKHGARDALKASSEVQKVPDIQRRRSNRRHQVVSQPETHSIQDLPQIDVSEIHSPILPKTDKTPENQRVVPNSHNFRPTPEALHHIGLRPERPDPKQKPEDHIDMNHLPNDAEPRSPTVPSSIINDIMRTAAENAAKKVEQDLEMSADSSGDPPPITLDITEEVVLYAAISTITSC